MASAGDRVGVGVSGGADSVALLRLLVELKDRLGIFPVVLHFNHQLRGAESDADEDFAASLAAEHGLECFAERADVAAAARGHRWNLEDAARRLRYAFFGSAVERHRLARCAVAHTADDQAETVLARLVRGTGPAGLAAIYPVKGHVIRPLLEIRRGELRQYLAGIGQGWREDLSNQDVTRLRARLRHQVLPVIERGLQPAIVSHLGRLAQLSREDEVFWSALVSERLAALVRREGGRLGIRSADLVAPLGATASGAGGGKPPARLSRRCRGGWYEASWGNCGVMGEGSARSTWSRYCIWPLRMPADTAQNCPAVSWSGVSIGCGLRLRPAAELNRKDRRLNLQGRERKSFLARCSSGRRAR